MTMWLVFILMAVVGGYVLPFADEADADDDVFDAEANQARIDKSLAGKKSGDAEGDDDPDEDPDDDEDEDDDDEDDDSGEDEEGDEDEAEDDAEDDDEPVDDADHKWSDDAKLVAQVKSEQPADPKPAKPKPDADLREVPKPHAPAEQAGPPVIDDFLPDKEDDDVLTVAEQKEASRKHSAALAQWIRDQGAKESESAKNGSEYVAAMNSAADRFKLLTDKSRPMTTKARRQAIFNTVHDQILKMGGWSHRVVESLVADEVSKLLREEGTAPGAESKRKRKRRMARSASPARSPQKKSKDTGGDAIDLLSPATEGMVVAAMTKRRRR